MYNLLHVISNDVECHMNEGNHRYRLTAFGELVDHCAPPSATVKRSESPWSVTVMTLNDAGQQNQITYNTHKRDLPNAEELSRSSSKRNVRPIEMVDMRLREHSIVLNLRLAQGRAVASNEHKLGCEPRRRQHRDLLGITLQSLEMFSKRTHPCQSAFASAQTCIQGCTCRT